MAEKLPVRIRILSVKLEPHITCNDSHDLDILLNCVSCRIDYPNGVLDNVDTCVYHVSVLIKAMRSLNLKTSPHLHLISDFALLLR